MGSTMAYRCTLCTPDGELFDEASYAYPPNVGDVIHVHGGKRMRVTAFIPAELAGEFVNGATHGVLEVEPA
jgi:hypothetical protein